MGELNGVQALTIERLVGRLEYAVQTLETANKDRQLECARHWAVTNSLVQSMTEANISHAAVAEEEKRAREILVAEATAANARVATSAANAARDKAAQEATIKEAVDAAAKTAMEAISTAAKVAKEAVAAEAVSRRQQRHWVVERLFQSFPWIVAAASAAVGWLFAKDVL